MKLKDFEKFEISYSVDDGYAGGARPQYFNLDQSWIEEDMSDEDIEAAINEIIQEDFQTRISWHCENIGAAVEWAKSIRDERTKNV